MLTTEAMITNIKDDENEKAARIEGVGPLRSCVAGGRVAGGGIRLLR